MAQQIVIMNDEGWPGISLAAEMLTDNRSLLDIVEESIKLVEAEEKVKTVSIGSAPNASGVMELDASIMDGDTLEVASIGALQNTLHPISVARKMLSHLPHVMLVGEGAERFARELGFAEQSVLSKQARLDYQKWRETEYKERLLDIFNPKEGKGCHGTVICLTRNSQGSFAGGVSTSGWDYKYNGRLGDSPIIGAGLYVDSEFGAAACTHCGENAIRTSLARSVVLYLKLGKTLTEAVAEGMRDLSRLKGGYQGQVVIYAVNKEGEHLVARRFKEGPPCHYYVYSQGMASPERREAQYLEP